MNNVLAFNLVIFSAFIVQLPRYSQSEESKQSVDTSIWHGIQSYTGQAVDATKQYTDKAVDATKQYTGQAIEWTKNDLSKAGKWQYKVATISSPEDLQEKLNGLGSDGWECGELKEVQGKSVLICKKPEVSFVSNTAQAVQNLAIGAATKSLKK